jgi:hypothetical protein
VGQHVLDVDLPLWVTHHHNQPIFVAANVEDDTLFNLIRASVFAIVLIATTFQRNLMKKLGADLPLLLTNQ